MSFVVKETKSGNVTGQSLIFKPSALQWTDIDQLQSHNRGANEPKENLDELYKAVKGRGGFVTPVKGYIDDDKKIKLTAGSRRLAVGQALEAEGEVFPLFVVIIEKPESDEEIREAIADNLSDNNFRAEDSPLVRYNSFRGMRDLGWTLEEIGDATGFSHTQVAWYLKTMDVPVLKKAILSNEISPRAAADFITEGYRKTDPKSGKPIVTKVEVNGKTVKRPVFDEEKIKKELEAAKKKAQNLGKGKVGGKADKADKQTTDTGSVEIRGMKAVRIILDEPEDNVPSIFKQFCKWLNGDQTTSNFKSIAKKNGYLDEVEWLFDIEFDAEKRKARKEAAKAAKEKAKADKAKKEKKANPQVADDDDVELNAEDYE